MIDQLVHVFTNSGIVYKIPHASGVCGTNWDGDTAFSKLGAKRVVLLMGCCKGSISLLQKSVLNLQMTYTIIAHTYSNGTV